MNLIILHWKTFYLKLFLWSVKICFTWVSLHSWIKFSLNSFKPKLFVVIQSRSGHCMFWISTCNVLRLSKNPLKLWSSPLLWIGSQLQPPSSHSLTKANSRLKIKVWAKLESSNAAPSGWKTTSNTEPGVRAEAAGSRVSNTPSLCEFSEYLALIWSAGMC